MASPEVSLICRRYREVFAANVDPAFASFLSCGESGRGLAALGYRRARSGPLQLEVYFDQPIEHVVSQALGTPVARDSIIEIGNFAADNIFMMVELWGRAANDLGGAGEIAVATLTAPLRRMFERIGIPFAELEVARPERLGARAANWGSYYELNPIVCAARIVDGQKALDSFLGRRNRTRAA